MKKTSIIFILLLIIVLILIFIFFPFGSKEEGKKNIEVVQGEENNPSQKILFSTLFPIRNEDISFPDLGEKAGIAILFIPQGKEEILYQKNIDEALPIASLTKIMTAMIALDNYSLSNEIEVSKSAVETEGTSGMLSPGERMTIEGLLDLSLLVSSNDASSALAEIIGEDKFIDLMNKKAEKIGLSKTHFFNPHGLDDDKNHEDNISSAYDLAVMTQYSIVNYPKIWEILGTKETTVIGKDSLGREILHQPRNVSRNLLSNEGVLGGKTGYTEDAGETMILAMKAPGEVEGNVVIVLLGMGIGERIQKAQQLYDWLFRAYRWE
ncbi:MAG TPA: serine hydrolase [Candidatus Pacearchaeota archaeon]|nr:serine hydrolase [Candidatus Pacearchaeota archaeon]HOK94187.1 serine hydrolase [Candidatus Pacearchaeota archaeon]HPO75173.1 serine hydrolase [Candidatus Pacearchaeota archaeon]